MPTCVLLADSAFWFLSRDLSVDAGLPPHQYHIHPLPQHYQHYLTSPRMHHFPRNNASTQVVSPLCLCIINHVRLDELLEIHHLLCGIHLPSNRGWPVSPLSRLLSAAELTPASFICHLLGCPWDQKLPISPVALVGSAESQPLPPRICR